MCPVRGHSNVQGDRTMGIFERPAPAFLDALEKEFGFAPPHEHGFDVVRAIRALRDGEAKVFFAMGGNFVSASPDTEVTEAAMRRARLTVHVSTKLNRSHVVTGARALILPTLGRTERDVQDSGEQFVTVEDSMGMVHASRGRLRPASPQLEVRAGHHLRARPPGPRRAQRRAVGGVREGLRHDPGPHRARDPRLRGLQRARGPARRLRAAARPARRAPLPDGHGQGELHGGSGGYPALPEGRLLLQTLRSHDQYNTTIYGLDDRYRGITGGRRVVLVHPEDARALGVAEGSYVDLVSEWQDGVERRAPGFRVVLYPTARGCAAAYYPETNVLVPLDATADTSNTPASKSVVVRLEDHTRGHGEPSGTIGDRLSVCSVSRQSDDERSRAHG